MTSSALRGFLRLLHLVERQVDGVQQRGLPLGLRERQPVLNLLQAGGEGLHQLARGR